MSNQYFENNENLRSEERLINFYFHGQIIRFISDLGVFSKTAIDFGSSQLLKTVNIKEHTNQILDVGCGYGTIGITIAKVFPKIHVDMVDVNLRAIALTKKNIELNNTKNASVFESNIYQNIHNTYDLIITNPPIRAGKQVVHEIILGAYEHLNEHGSLWCVIQKKQGAPSAIIALKEKYSDVVIHNKEKQYYIIEAVK